MPKFFKWIALTALFVIAYSISHSQTTSLGITQALKISYSQIDLTWHVEDPLTAEKIIIELSINDDQNFQSIDTVGLADGNYLLQDLTVNATYFLRLANLNHSVVSTSVMAYDKLSYDKYQRPDSIPGSDFSYATIIGDDFFYGLSNYPTTPQTPLYKLNLINRKWTRLASLPNPALRTSQFTIGNDIFLAYSGEDEFLDSFAKYNSVTDAWTELTFFTDPKNRKTALSTPHNGKGYYGFGTNMLITKYYDLWEYDPASNVWSQRADFTSFFTNESVMIMYGAGDYLYFLTNDNYLHRLDLEQNEFFFQYDRVPEVSGTFQNYFEVNDQLYVHFGGESFVNEKFWRYDSVSKQWLQVYYEYNFYSNRTIGSGKHIVTYGNGNGGAFNDLYALTDDGASTKADIALNLETQETGFTLMWSPAAAVGTSYKVEYSTNYGSTYSTLHTLPASEHTYHYTNPSANQTYFFRISSGDQPVYSNVTHGTIGPNWKRRKSMPGSFTNYYYELTPFYIDGTPYFFQDDTFLPGMARLWKYDADKDLWSRCSPFPGESRQNAVVFGTAGKGYIVSGVPRQPGSTLKDVWEYDPGSDSWEKKNDFPGMDRTAGFGFGNEQRGYIGLGYTLENSTRVALKDVWEYNPALDNWIQLEDFPGTSVQLANVMEVNDTLIYVGFGLDVSTNAYRNNVWQFDIKNKEWKELIPSSQPITVKEGIVSKGQLFSLESKKGGYLSRYDSAANIWSSLLPFPGSGSPYVLFEQKDHLYALQENGELWSYSKMPLAITFAKAEPVDIASLRLSWTNPSFAPGDSVVIKRLEEAGYTTVAKLPYNVTVYTDTLLTPGATYQYTLYAFNEFGISLGKNVEGVVASLDEAPANLVATITSSKQILLTWSNQSAAYYSIVIERSLDDTENFVALDTLPGTTISYTDGSFLEGTLLLNYRVRALGKGGFTDFSNVANAEFVITNIPFEQQPVHRVWPNPTTTTLTIELASGTAMGGSVSIHNLTGTTLATFELQDRISSYDVSSFHPGLYILKINTPKERTIYKVLKR